jgi:hypothetical protein
MKGYPIVLPPCGMFIGSGVYPMSKDYLLGTLHAHQSWMPQSLSQKEMIDLILRDNQGNLAQVWGYARGYAPSTVAEWQYALDEIGIRIPEPDWEKGTYLKASECKELKEHPERNGAGVMRFIREAAKRDIYTLLIYVSAAPEWAGKFQDAGRHYLGYDFGERYTFRLDEASTQGRKLESVTLKMLADDLMARVREHVDERHAAGWGNVWATSCNFYIDYEIASGTDVPLLEDFAFQHLNMASALSRGLTRQFDLPTWGSHMAHEHYSWIPNSSPYKYELLRAGMFQKYMAGCKVIINESGNWFVEASLCEDSPKFEFPRVPLGPKDVAWGGGKPMKFIPYIAEARKHFHKIDYGSANPRRYRKVISEFYDFVKANGTPEGQPETTVAIAKGNFDLCNHRYSPNAAIAGAFTLADKNPAWFEGAPERGWETVKKVFYPLPPVLGEHENAFLSGTPFGMVDVVSFVQDTVDAAFLNAHYKALLFAGWNTCSDRQYETLKTYVTNGGTLFISIPQLSTNTTRNYGDYGVNELVRGGDFSELCGVRVTGRGKRIYWATAPDNVSELGFKFPRRFGILLTCLGNLEITDPTMETLVVDDEEADPLLLRRRLGKGTVYFLNSWAYPGALDQDFGPGSNLRSPGLVGMIYRHIAKLNRGSVWMTDDGDEPGRECEFLNFSYFPDAGKICLYNVDFDKPHGAFLHYFGKTERVELGPAEFRILPTVKHHGRKS